MAKIKIEDLKPGMKFTKAVYMTPANILVGAQVPVNEKDLEKLKKWDIKEVETEGEIIETPEVDYSFQEKEEKQDDSGLQEKLIAEYKKLHKMKQKFKKHYEESSNELSKIIHGIKENRLLNSMTIYNISTDLISEVISNPHIFIYLASKMDNEKEYLAYHLLNSSIFSIMIGHLVNIDSKKLIHLAAGALVYDVGMAKIPQAIVMKTEKLTPNELNVIKLHTIYGYKQLIKDANFPSEIAAIALQHHEQFDGNGYPRKLKKDQIDLYSRIVSISDTFDAMTKKRSYRNEFLSYDAMKNILNQSQHKFDPNLIRVFLSNMSIYPIASLVKLNTNAVGLVIGANKKKPLRPVIKIVIDEFGDRVPEQEDRFIDLTSASELYITAAADENEYNIKVYDLI